MRAGELREFLAAVPDDAVVLVLVDHGAACQIAEMGKDEMADGKKPVDVAVTVYAPDYAYRAATGVGERLRAITLDVASIFDER